MCHLQVTKAKVYVEQKPWSRLHMGETSHDHGMRSMHPRSHQEKSTVCMCSLTSRAVWPLLLTGYVMTGTEIRTVAVDFDQADNLNVTAGEAVSQLDHHRMAWGVVCKSISCVAAPTTWSVGYRRKGLASPQDNAVWV